MLIDFDANPQDLTPDAFAARVRDAGLGGAVVARTHVAGDMTPWLSALEDLDLAAFAAVGLQLTEGRLVFLPDDWQGDFATTDWAPPNGVCWTYDEAAERADALGGILIAAHPFDRDGSPMGNDIYELEGLDAMITRSGAARGSWDREADVAARKLGAPAIGGSGGNLDRLGLAATVVSDDIMDETELAEALREGLFFTVELEPTSARKDRDPGRRGRGGDDRGGRGGRGDRDRGGRGDRDRGGRSDRGGRGGRDRGGRGDRDGNRRDDRESRPRTHRAHF